jgi:predicted nucleic-acid-binding Zn-ribbon protein
MANRSTCPACGSRDQFQPLKPVRSGGGQAPNLLPGLGTWYQAAAFELVLCADCGLTRFYAVREAREKLRTSAKWRRVG